MVRMSLDVDLAALRSLAELTAHIPNIRSATPETKKTEETIDSLITLLERIQTDLTSDASIFKNNDLQQQLGVLISQCRVSIIKLNAALENSTGSGADAILNVDQLQNELSVRYRDLADFADKAGLGSMARKDDAVDGSHDQEAAILEAVDKILTDEDVSKETPKSDHSAAWKNLLVKLKVLGFKTADVERHKTSISHRLSEALHLHHRVPSSAITPLDQAGGTVERPRLVIPDFTERIHAPVRSPTMTYAEHLARAPPSRSNYRPPAASTICDDSDDDAASECSDASTLLGPVDDRLREEHYVLHSPASASPLMREPTPRPRPRSPLVPDEKILASSSRDVHTRAWPGTNYHVPLRPPPRTTGSMARPSSPRERDPRYSQQYFTAPRQSGPPMSPAADPRYTVDTLVGRRTRSNPVWLYRRPGDMFPPVERQSMDTQDYTLPEAATEGRYYDVNWLLQEGFNIESTGSRNENAHGNFWRTTPLFRAAIQGHFAIVHLLLRHHANPNPHRTDGRSLVRLLASQGAIEILRLLIEYGADVQHQRALPQAANSGKYDVVQLLLEHGADVNEVSKQSALYWAASHGFPQIVELLLREDADTEITTSEYTPLYKAVRHGHLQCVRLLLQYGARPTMSVGPYGETLLHIASSLGDEAIVRELLRRRVPPNEPNNGYRSRNAVDGRRRFPLHFAAKGGHVGVARALLEYNADPNVMTEDGRGPVDIAIDYEYHEMRDLLSRAGGYPLQSSYDRIPGYRILDMDSARGSYVDDQVRRFSTTLPERPRYDRRHSALATARSFENDRRRDRSANGSRRNEHKSKSSKVGATAALLGSAAVMMLGG